MDFIECDLHSNGVNARLFDLYDACRRNASDTSDNESVVSDDDDLNISDFIGKHRASETRLESVKTLEEVLERRKSVCATLGSKESPGEEQEVDLPWDIDNETNNETLLNIINGLICELRTREQTYPALIAEKIREKLDQELENLRNFTKLNVEPPQTIEKKYEHDKVLNKKLTEIASKMQKVSTLINDLKIVKDLVKK